MEPQPYAQDVSGWLSVVTLLSSGSFVILWGRAMSEWKLIKQEKNVASRNWVLSVHLEWSSEIHT